MDWSPGSLRLLRRNAAMGYTLKQLAARLDTTPAECDRALWALIGRTAGGAALVLNRQRAA